MKKLLFVFVVFFLFSACDQQNEFVSKDDFSKEIAHLQAMNKDGLYLVSTAMKQNLKTNLSGEFILNEQGLVNDLLRGWDNTYFIASDEFTSSLLNEFSPKNLTFRASNRTQLLVNRQELSKMYSNGQILLIEPFLNELFLTEGIVDFKDVALSFQEKVIASSLEREDKLELITLAVSVQVLSEFMEADGGELIKDALTQLKNTQESGSRTADCSVNVRNVLLAGVTGAVYMGVKGTVAGCAGGTIALPIFGTATGCIGGAVFGSTLGFVEGVGLGIAAELLGSCFR